MRAARSNGYPGLTFRRGSEGSHWSYVSEARCSICRNWAAEWYVIRRTGSPQRWDLELVHICWHLARTVRHREESRVWRIPGITMKRARDIAARDLAERMKGAS